jgi:2-oxoglutarate dehydrogenase E1 component
MGPWFFVAPEIESVMEELGFGQKRLIYAGRPVAAAPATGLLRRHNREQAALLDAALTLPPSSARATATPAGTTVVDMAEAAKALAVHRS